MRSYYKSKSLTQREEIIEQLKAGKRVAYCCMEQKQYDRAKEQLVDTLKAWGEDVSLADNFICQLPGKADGLSAKIYLDEYKP